MVIFTGASVEEAIQNGLKTLDIPRMERISLLFHVRKRLFRLVWQEASSVDVEPIAETTVSRPIKRL